MKLKDRMKTCNFWISIASAIYLIISAIGKRFNFSIDQSLYNDIITSICSIFVILGIISGSPNQENDGKAELNTDEQKQTSEKELSGGNSLCDDSAEFNGSKPLDDKNNAQMQNNEQDDEDKR